MYCNEGIITQFNFGQGQQVSNVLKVTVQPCRDVQKGCWVCESRPICRIFCVRLNPVFYLQSLVQCMCMNFVNQVLRVCVPSDPAPSARLGAETDFRIVTGATLICCKRSGNWSPLAGASVKWIAEQCPSAALLCCAGIALEMDPSGKFCRVFFL